MALEVMGCGFGEGMMLDTGGEKTEGEGDFGGEWRDDFLVGMIELFKIHNNDVLI